MFYFYLYFLLMRIRWVFSKGYKFTDKLIGKLLLRRGEKIKDYNLKAMKRMTEKAAKNAGNQKTKL